MTRLLAFAAFTLVGLHVIVGQAVLFTGEVVLR